MNKGRQRGMGGQRPKAKPTQVLRRLWRYLKRYQWIIIFAALLSVAGNLLGLVSPRLSGAAIDAIIPGAVDMPVVIRYVVLMVVVAVLSAGMNWLLAAVMIRLSRSVVTRMRKEVFDHLTTLPIEFFDTHQTGDVISVLSYDIDTVGASLRSPPPPIPPL